MQSAAIGNDAHNLMMQLTEEKRRYALAHFIRTAGEPCPQATETFYQGNSKSGSAFWNARCSNARTYVVEMTVSGQSRILDCRLLHAVAKVRCFTRF